MSSSLLIHGTAIWGILLFAAVFNGLFRDQGYGRRVGEHRAHQISSIVFSGIIFGVTWLYLSFNQRGDFTNFQLLLLGAWWVLLTVIFEFGFFHFVMKKPLHHLLKDCNPFKGRLFGLVLLSCLFAPYLVHTAMRP